MENLGLPIVPQARTWIGTRFHHQGRLKKTAAHCGGVDCLGLLVGVARELDLRDANGMPLHLLDSTDYAHMPDGSALIHGLRKGLHEIPLREICAGDVALFTMESAPRHLAIISEAAPHSMIHAYAQARKVVEQQLDAWWRRRLSHAFRLIF